MKSLKDYSLNLPESEYHNYPAWSHSMIARYARDGFSSLATIHEPVAPTPSMEFGSLFDSMITRGKETLDNYVVCDVVAPPAEKNVFDYIISLGIKDEFKDIDEQTIVNVMDACGFYPKFKTNTRLEKLYNTCDYYNARRTGKSVVSQEDWDDAVNMFRAFKSNDYLKELFGNKNGNGIEYIYQAQFVVDLPCSDGTVVKFKIMPDLLKVNHNNKTVQPVDLKTSHMPAYDFKENFLKFRYDIEAACYTDVLRMVMDNDDDYKDYAILPYLFTDISRTDKVPVTFVYDPNSESQKDGFSYTSCGKEYRHKHWAQYLVEIIEYEDNHASVPSYIKTDEPNDILSLINK